MFERWGLNPGYAAGLCVSVLWTFTTLLFTAGGRRIGPAMVNAVRLVVALMLHALTHRWLQGHWVPEVRSWQVLCLGLSGVLGLTIGDHCIIRAFITIGPRRSLLVMTAAPLMAALFGWAALDERLAAQAWVGIALTIGGVAWVIRERTTEGSAVTSSHRMRGYLMALAAAVCQAAGLMLSKRGMGYGVLADAELLAPQSATLVRMAFAVVGTMPVLIYGAMRGRALRDRAAGREADASGSYVAGAMFAACGAVTGPFLGVWLSLVAASRVPIGIAQTLLSLSPIMILPAVRWLYHERVSARAIVGTALAVIGISVLFAGG